MWLERLKSPHKVVFECWREPTSLHQVLLFEDAPNVYVFLRLAFGKSMQGKSAKQLMSETCEIEHFTLNFLTQVSPDAVVASLKHVFQQMLTHRTSNYHSNLTAYSQLGSLENTLKDLYKRGA